MGKSKAVKGLAALSEADVAIIAGFRPGSKQELYARVVLQFRPALKSIVPGCPCEAECLKRAKGLKLDFSGTKVAGQLKWMHGELRRRGVELPMVEQPQDGVDVPVVAKAGKPTKKGNKAKADKKGNKAQTVGATK